MMSCEYNICIIATIFFSYIIKKRKSYEYKINGYCKSLQDIKDYIEHERYFLRQVAIRRDKHGIYNQRRNIEHKVIERVKTLYEIGMNLKHDYGFSLSYFKFCKLYGYHDVAKSHIKDMTDKFSFKPEVWQIASTYYKEISKKEAQFIINKGLQFHKDCKSLYTDALELELDSEVTNFSTSVVCQRLKKYCETIFKNIKDFKFWLEILVMLQSQKFTKTVQDMIIAELLQKYSDKELVWKCLAEREKDGFHYAFHGESNLMKNNEEPRELTSKDCLQRCIDVYERGFTKLPVDKKPKLRLLYLDTLIAIQKQNFDVPDSFKTNLLREKLEAANKETTLEEKHFAAWIECCNNEEAVAEVLTKATSSLPTSLLLWQLRLKYLIEKDKDKDVAKVFDEAIKNLKESAEPIWTTYIAYHSLRSKDERIKEIYLEGLKAPEPISNALKPAYVEWLAMSLGIEEARKAYKEIAAKEPYCKELHQMMSKLESYEIPNQGLNFDEWSWSLQLACDQFAKTDIDVYLNYIMFYQKQYKTFDSNKRIQQIYEEAQKNLPEILFAEFKDKFNNIIDKE